MINLKSFKVFLHRKKKFKMDKLRECFCCKEQTTEKKIINYFFKKYLKLKNDTYNVWSSNVINKVKVYRTNFSERMFPVRKIYWFPCYPLNSKSGDLV